MFGAPVRCPALDFSSGEGTVIFKETNPNEKRHWIRKKSKFVIINKLKCKN